METTDSNGDGKPDGAVLTTDERQKMLNNVVNSTIGAPSNSLVNATFNPQNNTFDIGFNASSVQQLSDMAGNLVNGLKC